MNEKHGQRLQAVSTDDNTCDPPFVQVADGQCQTEMREIKFSFLWTIRNLGLIWRRRRHLNSSTFSAKEAAHTKFCLQLHPEEFIKDAHKLHVCLVQVSNTQVPVAIKSKISVINNRGVEIKISEKTEERFSSSGIIVNSNSFSVTQQFLKVGNPPEEKLTVYCEVTILAELITETRDLHEKNSNQISEDGAHFSDFGFSSMKPEFSDVTLVSEGKEFFAHKVILAGRSPVFAAMFTHEMEEKTQNRVDIADLGHEVVEEMLRFIYTGRALRLETMAADLLVAADKYALKGLIRDCEKALSRNMTVETASEILVLADMHQLNPLKDKAIDFINKHSADVRKTKGWKVMAQNHPHLIMEAFLLRPGHLSYTLKMAYFGYNYW